MESHSANDGAIFDLQRFLRQLSYDNDRISAPPVDGIFGPSTEKALNEFQREMGLPVRSYADEEAWDKLFDAYRASLARNAPPARISVFPQRPAGLVLSSGSKGFAVAAVQYLLRELQYLYRSDGEIPITGIYDERTLFAVRNFQEQNGLTADGGTDLLTWNCLAEQYNVLFSRWKL